MMIEPTIGGFPRCLSLNPMPTLKVYTYTRVRNWSLDMKQGTYLSGCHDALERAHYTFVLSLSRFISNNFGLRIVKRLKGRIRIKQRIIEGRKQTLIFCNVEDLRPSYRLIMFQINDDRDKERRMNFGRTIQVSLALVLHHCPAQPPSKALIHAHGSLPLNAPQQRCACIFSLQRVL